MLFFFFKAKKETEDKVGGDKEIVFLLEGIKGRCCNPMVDRVAVSGF